LQPGQAYSIVQDQTLVGRSRLEFALGRGPAAAGRLLPAPAYDRVRPVFRLYERAVRDNDRGLLQQFVRERDALGLRVVGPDDTELDASVELIREWELGALVIYVTVRDERYWRQTQRTR
jgi:hypothetical protein